MQIDRRLSNKKYYIFSSWAHFKGLEKTATLVFILPNTSSSTSFGNACSRLQSKNFLKNYCLKRMPIDNYALTTPGT